ncbi:MAG TPA: flagellar filament capping protein FliD [Bryobacteraceae bacterium]|nr:flagellar filament capping protein FliD [Bryobacteraceae bacterium]
MSTSPIPPPTFTGTSKYASDFQQVLARAVSIASLPLQQLQNQEINLTNEEQALSSLQTTFGSLQTAIQNLTSVQSSLYASVADPSTVSATADSTALPGTYSIQVTSLGSYTTTLSNAGSPAVTDPTKQNISSASSFTLTINGTNTTITPSGSSLDDLANAINAAGVAAQATVVNVGSNSSPDYRLSVTSNNLAADTIQLNDGTNNLLTNLSTGSAATYQVDGLTSSISSNSRTVTLAPGLTVNLLATNTGNWDNITVARNTAGISNDLSALATAYNAAADALNQQHGQGAGALSGDSLVNSLGQVLQSISLYTGGSGSVTSLTDVGLNLDSSGHLSFDPTVLNSASPAAVQQFLGSATSGFLLAATNAMNSVTDPVTGMIQNSISSVQTQITNTNNQISDEQTRITDLQNTMQQQLSAADAAIAVLQQQVTYMSSLFATMYPGAGNNNIMNSNNPTGG